MTRFNMHFFSFVFCFLLIILVNIWTLHFMESDTSPLSSAKLNKIFYFSKFLVQKIQLNASLYYTHIKRTGLTKPLDIFKQIPIVIS